MAKNEALVIKVNVPDVLKRIASDLSQAKYDSDAQHIKRLAASLEIHLAEDDGTDY